ncbi:hypothetical protein DFR50_13028 [Roseiarcus fermentans]|uniref:Uncharacterized protein n=1 Tax=Roseiarcus fermentans TaxID=1473586 RepID=A0A366EVP2_9HYPH|nr:hypothetical protein [Roseiarcus fermentans]RBP06471.1 hypothetical protein DFR50_13028 [Roseiarcus fermentans]
MKTAPCGLAANGAKETIDRWLGRLSGAALALGLTLAWSSAASAQCAAYHAASGPGSVGTASSGGGVHAASTHVSTSPPSCSAGGMKSTAASPRPAARSAANPGVGHRRVHATAVLKGSVGAKKPNNS